MYGHDVDSNGKQLQKVAWSGINLLMWMAAVKHGRKWYSGLGKFLRFLGRWRLEVALS